MPSAACSAGSKMWELLQRLGPVLGILWQRGDLAADAKVNPVLDICCADHAPRFTVSTVNQDTHWARTCHLFCTASQTAGQDCCSLGCPVGQRLGMLLHFCRTAATSAKLGLKRLSVHKLSCQRMKPVGDSCKARHKAVSCWAHWGSPTTPVQKATTTQTN